MSYSVDVNLLLYASIAASPFHERADEFLKRCRAGGDVFCLAWPTLMSYLRMVTHAAIVSPPLAPAAAMENVESLIRLPHVRLLGELEDFWDVYRDVAANLPVRGKLVPDAHLAALLRQHGVTVLYTNDGDFRKFDFLKVRNPFAES